MAPSVTTQPKALASSERPELGAIYRAHAQTVARWAARLGGPLLDPEDVVQEVFLIAQRLLPGFRGEAQVTTWLFRITRNVVRHRRRRARLWRLLRGAGDEAARQLPSQRPSPLEDLERLEAQATVYRALDAMSEKYRTAFVLFEMEGLSGQEVAALMGQRVSTIWVWLHRARAQFLKELERIELKANP
ncbi:MAG: RNA polymerase sigma factor [Myxococcales bacterium]|nr:RNA polymerase sigma factor [Myxococcota bacterium]MDW8281306.1 RNA polymerase sigma factor [Myxococcales bacterium]